jgi:hypothetical protein
MTEELREALEGFKVWRNPTKRGEPVAYLGQYRPPNGRFFFIPKDFLELGFGPGDYTVRVPEGSPYAGMLSKWQKVSVPND